MGSLPTRLNPLEEMLPCTMPPDTLEWHPIHAWPAGATGKKSFGKFSFPLFWFGLLVYFHQEAMNDPQPLSATNNLRWNRTEGVDQPWRSSTVYLAERYSALHTAFRAWFAG
eukprot:3976295-Amphidinium_carterae.1